MIRLIGSLKGKRRRYRLCLECRAAGQSIAEAARVADREVALVGRAMRHMISCARETGYLRDFPDTIDEGDASEIPA